MSDGIVIKRVKKYAAGHHGGAWKIAYADFVTAMMAFFLLLWLLNAVTEEQLQGISNYFAPTSLSTSPSGAGGMLGGKTIGEGASQSQSGSPSITVTLPPPSIGLGGDAFTSPNEGEGAGVAPEVRQGTPARDPTPSASGQAQRPNDRPPSGTVTSQQASAGGPSQGEKFGGQREAGEQLPGPSPEAAGQGRPAGDQGGEKAGLAEGQDVSEGALKQMLAAQEQQEFEKAAQVIQDLVRQAVKQNPQLEPLSQALILDNTPEGLRIQIVDQEGLTMFPAGGARPVEAMYDLLNIIARVIRQMPQKIAISGYTDAVPFSNPRADYGNWELSADRALISRRILVDMQVPQDRITRVVGKADTDPYITANPRDPRNRRISIVLLRENAEIPANGIPNAPTALERSTTARSPSQPLPPTP